MEEAKNIPTGKLARAKVAGVTAARVGLKHLSFLGKQSFRGQDSAKENKADHEVALAKILFQALSQLRGTALKISQILSMEEDLFPESIRKELAKACHQVLPLNRALVRKVFKKELGLPPEKVFRHFTPTAFAAASLGQVHEAISPKGDFLAVKVQYPGIANSIESDLKVMKGLILGFMAKSPLFPNENLLQILFQEIGDRLREEVDYRQEAENTQWFFKNIQFPHVRIPEVLEEWSSEKILTCRKLSGLHLHEWLATNPSQEERDHFGQVLFDFFFYCLFELKCLHADPHPGNFLFMENGDLGVLDFGCIKRLSDDFPSKIAEVYQTQILDHFEDQSEKLLKCYQTIEILPDEVTVDQYSKEIRPLLRPIQQWLVEPFLKSSFDFRESSSSPYPKNLSEGLKSMRALQGVHQNQIYFDRSYMGIMRLLRLIGARVKTENQYFTPVPLTST